MRMCLTDKVQNNQLIVSEALPADGKSKTLSSWRKVLPGAGKTTLVLTEKLDENLLKAAKNVVNLKIQIAKDVNVVDLLHHQYVIAAQNTLPILEKRLAWKYEFFR